MDIDTGTEPYSGYETFTKKVILNIRKETKTAAIKIAHDDSTKNAMFRKEVITSRTH